jgi:hypothetical protein
VLVGASMMAVFATVNSLVQLITTNEMRGRVMSVYNFAFRGGMPMGNLLSGWLVPVFTAPVVLSLETDSCLFSWPSLLPAGPTAAGCALRSGEAADSLVAPLTFSILSKRFGPLSSGTGVYLIYLDFLTTKTARRS